MSGRTEPCKRGCCWNPLGVCGKRGQCACHGQPDIQSFAPDILAEQKRLKKGAYYDKLRENQTWTL